MHLMGWKRERFCFSFFMYVMLLFFFCFIVVTVLETASRIGLREPSNTCTVGGGFYSAGSSF